MPRVDGYLPIENYGIIGNLRTCALVGIDGSIDWLCLPHFDSGSVFGSLIDAQRGGRFRIAPVGPARNKQFYWPDTNVLITRFLGADGVVEIEDFMPAGVAPEWRDQLIRRVRVVRGEVDLLLECDPAFDYARASHTTQITKHGAVFTTTEGAVGLASAVPLERRGSGVVARFRLRAGEHHTFVFRPLVKHHECTAAPHSDTTQELFERTVEFWRKWLAQSTYSGRFREMVNRSALALKLLTFEPTGAIVAAPTCSLPEALGGTRNWDYRYTWLRDAAFTVYALMRLGFTEEASRFMDFLEARCHEMTPGGPPLQIVYGIDGRHDLPEIELHHLSGYRGSAPVRIGNGASRQLQLDIYGELLDAVYLFNKHGSPISYELWRHLRTILDWVAANWKQPDAGIWEVRHGHRDFVYSRLMCWVALDRGIRLADKRSFPADHERWHRVRDEIYEDVMARGFSTSRNAFVQSYGSEQLDASNLIMPLVFFVAPTDPRMLATIDAIRSPATEGGLESDGLVYRYDERVPDGLRGIEGTFNMCTFWLVEALTRAGRSDRRRLDEARLLFERMLGYASHVGLYAEQTGPTGESLGNFPQAFTHIALISAAFNLDRALGHR
jgi:GH15 family glucan-1,4-alpha-glucosidase